MLRVFFHLVRASIAVALGLLVDGIIWRYFGNVLGVCGGVTVAGYAANALKHAFIEQTIDTTTENRYLAVGLAFFLVPPGLVLAFAPFSLVWRLVIAGAIVVALLAIGSRPNNGTPPKGDS